MNKTDIFVGQQFGLYKVCSKVYYKNSSQYVNLIIDHPAAALLPAECIVKPVRTQALPTEPNFSQIKSRQEFKSRFTIARGIKQRTECPSAANYKHYGGRGIKNLLGSTVSEIFLNLLLVEGYFPGASIDRIDCNGDYTLSNLRWVSARQQNQNKNNSTKEPGVHYRADQNAWIVSVMDDTNTRINITKTHFSVKKLGEVEAYNLALKAREHIKNTTGY